MGEGLVEDGGQFWAVFDVGTSQRVQVTLQTRKTQMKVVHWGALPLEKLWVHAPTLKKDVDQRRFDLLEQIIVNFIRTTV